MSAERERAGGDEPDRARWKRAHPVRYCRAERGRGGIEGAKERGARSVIVVDA